MNVSCQQRAESLKQIAFRSYPRTYLLQLYNIMLLVDWLVENEFLHSLNTQKNGIFSCLHDYISSPYDIIQITLNDYSSRY